MAQIIWTEPALQDLDRIAEYIALDKLAAAKDLVRQVFARVDKLGQFPQSGRKPPELPRSSRYREVIVGPCRIFYRPEKTKVFILYVMRSEMLLRQFMFEDRSLNQKS